MAKKPKPIDPEFKNKVAWEALVGDDKLRELAVKYSLDQELIKSWRQEILDQAVAEFYKHSKKGPLSQQDSERIVKKKFNIK